MISSSKICNFKSDKNVDNTVYFHVKNNNFQLKIHKVKNSKSGKNIHCMFSKIRCLLFLF